MIELKIDELVIRTKDVIMQFVKKRDILLKLIEKDLIRLSKRQNCHLRQLPIGEKSLAEELDMVFLKLVKFDIDHGLKLVYDIGREYYQIYNREVPPDIMKYEIIRFLSTSADNLLTYATRLDELYTDISSFYKYLENISTTRTEYTDGLREQMDAITICKYQYHESASQLMEAIKYFNIPTECPPHL